jgi:ParB/RepB/Spo0J family partition protein
MAEHVQLINTSGIKPNPDNPRLIFHQEELDALRDSIQKQGILVPLSVYRDGKIFHILDGERRWRCALKLGLPTVPAIVQPKPGPLQNLMMMFAIHHRRNEWDPLPTAIKLEKLIALYEERQGVKPTERQLAELGSLTIGEVRRLKKLLALPDSYKSELMAELHKPRSQQKLTVDLVLEATAAASALRKRGVIKEREVERLRRAIVDKFVNGVVESTVDPRKLSRLARAVARDEIDRDVARAATMRFIREKNYSIRKLFEETVEESDFQHSVELLAARVTEKLDEVEEKGFSPSPALLKQLRVLARRINSIVRG